MSLLRGLSSSDARSSTISMLLRASHACPCLISCLSHVRHIAVQAAFSHDSSSDEDDQVAAPPIPSSWKPSSTFKHSKLLWQQVAGLSEQRAQQLLHQQPFLQPILQTAFHHSHLSSNMQTLQRLGINCSHPMSEELRAYLSLIPPRLLQDLVSDWDHADTARLRQALSRIGLRISQQQKQEQRMQHVHQQPSQPAWQHLLQVLEHVQQHQQPPPSPLQQLAAAVTEALGLSQQPISNKVKVDQVIVDQALKHVNSSRPSSNGTHRDLSPMRHRCTAISNSKPYHTAAVPATVTYDQVLAAALERTSRSVHLRGRAPPNTDQAADYMQQMQQYAGVPGTQLFELVVKRPALLWTVDQASGPVLQLLQQQLPALAATAAQPGPSGRRRQPHQQKHRQQKQITVLGSLLMQNPSLSSITKQQAEQVLDLLLKRLKLTPDEAAAAVAANPRLLLNPFRNTSLNLGFLVGLGFKPVELKQMLTADPSWVTRQLKELTLNWKFITSVAKVRAVAITQRRLTFDA